MFDGYTIYGPYGSDRKIVVLVSPEHRTTMSYAKYLMALKLGRVPGENGEDEVVDHIDNNRMNDVIENLQVLTAKENEEKETRRRAAAVIHITFTCPQCGVEFKRLRRYVKATVPKPCCSRSCSAKFHLTGRKRK